MLNRKVKINFQALIKLAVITFFRNWVNVFFSFVFPFIWLVITFYTFGAQIIKYDNHQVLLFRYIFSSISLTSVLSLALLTVPYTFGFARLSGRYKNYATVGIKPIQYLGAYFLVAFLGYFMVENIMLLACNFGCLHSHFISSLQYFLIWLINLYIFISLFLIASCLSLIPTHERMLTLIVQAYFLFNLLLSGVTIPAIGFNPKMFVNPSNQADSWFKFIQYLSPTGCACRIGQNIMTPILWNWETDWLSIFMPLCFSAVAIYFIIKKFTWVKK